MNRAIRKKNKIITTAPEIVTTGFPSLQTFAIAAPHPPAKGEINSVTKIVVTHLVTDPPDPVLEAPLLTYSDPATTRPQAVYARAPMLRTFADDGGLVERSSRGATND